MISTYATLYESFNSSLSHFSHRSADKTVFLTHMTQVTSDLETYRSTVNAAFVRPHVGSQWLNIITTDI